MKREEALKAIADWMKENPKIKQANHTLVSLLVAAQGTLIDKDDNEMAYIFQLQNDEHTELSGRYEVSIKKLED